MSTVAVILSGGEGKRFTPLLESKPLFPFLGKPLIQHTLELVKEAGISKVVIVSNPRDKKALENLNVSKLQTQVIVQEDPTGMSNAVLAAKKHIADKSILILNASDVVEKSLFVKIKKELTINQDFIIAKQQKSYFDGGYLSFNGNKLTGIVEKPGKGNQPSDLVNLVFHFFKDSSEFLKLLESEQSINDDIYEKALSSYIKKHAVKVIKYSGYWQPLKYPWHVIDITKFLLSIASYENNAAFVAKTATIDKNVFLGKGVKILDNAVIKGPSYIGDNTIIGTNSLIIESMVGANCVIGFTCEVTRSYLGNHTWLHHNYIGDSILEGKHFFGNGAVTANFRLDSDHIRSGERDKSINTGMRKLGAIVAKGASIGVNASLMPGVKIGANSIVGPGVVQYSDVDANKKIFTKQNTTIKDKHDSDKPQTKSRS